MVYLPVKKPKVNGVTKGGAVVVAALLPLVAVPAAGAATVPPLPSPATVLTVFPWEGSMEDELQGVLCQAQRTCVEVNQFPFDPNGVATIEAAIDGTGGTKIVFGYSEGAVGVTGWLEQHADDPDAPSTAELSFVLIGNSTRAYGGTSSRVMPQTQYQVIDVARQYDTAADFPDNPFNLLALFNAWAGFGIHTNYEGVNIYDPANAVWTEGNTTYVLVPTENLPLLEPLRLLGLTALADALNGPLKAIVEQAYNRPVPFPTTAQPPPPAISLAAAAPALSASVVSDPTVASRDAAVPVKIAPTPAAAADSAPRSTQPEIADGSGEGLAVADTITTTTSPADRADVLDTVKAITPPAVKPGLDDAVAAKRSTTAPTTHTTVASTTDGNKVEPGKVGENQAAAKSGDQSPSTEDGNQSPSTEEDGEKAANSDG